MANHSPDPDNYVEKKTWDEAIADAPASQPTNEQKAADATKRAKDKGAAANNGGGAGQTTD